MTQNERWVSLDAAAKFYSGGTPSKANPEYWGGDIPWVSAKDMKSFRVNDAEDHVTAAGLENGTRIAPVGATLVLYEKSGQYVGGTTFVEGLVPFRGCWYLYYYGTADSRVRVAVWDPHSARAAGAP